MDKIPSQSLSKTLLIATPLFLVVLAILNSSQQLSYLFILKFINNVGGQADLTFIPTVQPVAKNKQFNDQILLQKFNLTNQQQTLTNVPSLVNISVVNQWASNQQLVLGTSPRWLIPASTLKSDILLLFMNIEKEKQIDIGRTAGLKLMKNNQIALSQQIANSLNLKIGDKIQINLQLNNMLKGSKLLEKFQDQQSVEEYKPQQQATFSIDTISHLIYQTINSKKITQISFTQKDISDALALIYNSSFTMQYTVHQIFSPSGIYPSAFHNVVILEYDCLADILGSLFAQQIREGKLTIFIPQEFRPIFKTYIETQAMQKQVVSLIKQGLRQICLLQVVSLNSRTQIYHPSHPINIKFSKMLESVPGSVEVIVLYPLYIQSLAIKYFFQSVIQIFTFVSCLLYFYTMTLVLKQLYQQKEIQVGLWRTLGAGGIRKMEIIEVEPNRNNDRNKNHYMSLKERFFYFWQILNKVGYIQYWLFSCLISITLYLVLKWFLFRAVCATLNFPTIGQSWSSPIIIFFGVLFLIEWITLGHIYRIYNNPLVETIKPVKRTFDLVKIRIIDFSTFGISSDSLLVAIMLVYYGVTAYYFIPFAILDNNQLLQIWLFNSIFVFMILGSVLLVTVLQSRLQIGIVRILGRVSQRFRKLRKIMMKNIQAKQYRNIKVSLIIALIFAFLLFFSAGIKIEIRIVQSFIERALGSDIVLENYQKNTFNTTLINNYLQSKNIKHAWLSKILNEKGIKFSFISHVTKLQINKPIKILTSQYLTSTYSKYYVPTEYLESNQYYSTLPQGYKNGFDMLYDVHGQSRGRYNPNDTFTKVDPYQANTLSRLHNQYLQQVAPQQQVINLVVSKNLLKTLGAKVGSLYKLKVENQNTSKSYLIRSRIVHSFQAGPGFDILWSLAFISDQQAKYLYGIIDKDINTIKNEKLFILKSEGQGLQGVGQTLLSMCPDHTQLFEMVFVSKSFSILTQYLDYFVLMITVIMAMLSVIFLSIYTISKCRDEAEMFKMLRSIGVTVSDIRAMIFVQIFIRIVVSIVSGVLLGLLLSYGFSKQIEQFLMINTPPIDLTNIAVIALVLIVVFGLSVSISTRYLKRRTVLNTTKL